MRRILTVSLLALGGTMATSGVAAADVEDIRFLSADQQLFGSASEVEVTGQIRCAATLEYGLWAGVAWDNGATDQEVFVDNGSKQYDQSEPDQPADAEGVGAFGPNFDPPVGVSDDSPCSQSLQSYDVVVEQNRDSGDFPPTTSDLTVFVAGGTSAEDGGRGPGPFIGDIAGFQDDNFDFDRTR